MIDADDIFSLRRGSAALLIGMPHVGTLLRRLAQPMIDRRA